MTPFRQSLNENTLAVIMVIVSLFLGFNLNSFSHEFLQINSTKVINLSLLLGSFFALVKLLRGIDCDVVKEIFEEKNTAAAILVGLLAVALSLAITVVS